MSPDKYRDIQEKYHQLFGGDPILVRSPGRINLIGEHTDYNDGFVLPAAIDKEIVFCMSLNESGSCNLYSQDLQDQFSFELNQVVPSQINWANYIMGVVQQLQKRGNQVLGFDCVFGGDIPIGSGLSSSAALECGMAFGLSQLHGFNLTKLELAKMGQAAENEFVGMQCGLMDQYASVFGKAGYFIQLDCRQQTHREAKVDLQDYGLWLFNSNVKHQHSTSEYNLRRQECEAGVRMIQSEYPDIKNLRDCNLSMLSVIKDNIVFQRCEFVIEENQRVLDCFDNLQSGDLKGIGEKMYSSHHGLSSKYQVSCPEMDLLVNYTQGEPDVLGSRMMGGGFGGCTINLIKKDAADALIAEISQKYQSETGKTMDVIPVKVADGTSLIALEPTIKK